MLLSLDWFSVAADNQVKAGQQVMEALLEVLSFHKANVEVARQASRAIAHICYNGIHQPCRSLLLYVFWRCFSYNC